MADLTAVLVPTIFASLLTVGPVSYQHASRGLTHLTIAMVTLIVADYLGFITK